jgi:hypothetical protein
MVAVLVACLVAEPTDCRTIEWRLIASMPHSQWSEAMGRADEWLKTHPDTEKRDLRVVRGQGV